MEETTPLSHEDVFFQMLDFGTSKSNSDVSKSNSLKITQEDSVATEGAVSHNVLLLPSRLIYILVTHSVIFLIFFYYYQKLVSRAFKEIKFTFEWKRDIFPR